VIMTFTMMMLCDSWSEVSAAVTCEGKGGQSFMQSACVPRSSKAP
jgi:hypothetical protein